jgi:hypothetical protein
VAPKIVPFATVALLQRGERVTITCTMAKGDAPLTIGWLKDGEPVGAGGDVKVLTFDQFNSMLTIESLELRHVANYTCMAENAAGTALHSQAVLVNGKRPADSVPRQQQKINKMLELSSFSLPSDSFIYSLKQTFDLKLFSSCLVMIR